MKGQWLVIVSTLTINVEIIYCIQEEPKWLLLMLQDILRKMSHLS